MSSEDVLSRLERVTARLEQLEAHLARSSGAPAASSTPAAAVANTVSQSDAAFVAAFDKLVTESLNVLSEKAKACGTDVEASFKEFQNAIGAQRAMLAVASRCKKPSDEEVFRKILQPTSNLMAKVESLRDRRSKCFNHLSMIAEGVACLQWVCVDKTPASLLGDMMPGSEMYGNKVIVEHKGKSEENVLFAQGFKNFLVELQKYVKAHHATGLSWNSNGGTDYFAAAAPAAAVPSAAGPPRAGPPPPPPPPPPGFFDEKPKQAPAAGGAAAVFAELNARGEAGATSGLRKVTKDQMTHKNPALRASSVVAAGSEASSKPGASGAPAAAAPAAKKPPRMELQGSKWFIERFEGNRELKITECSVKTAVCLVQCKASLLQIPGKINTLQIDGCTKTSVVVDSCVGSIDIINCKSCEIQVTGSTPMVTMDGCAGVMLYLSAQCLADDVAMVSSKCSEVNVVLPAKTEEEDPVELAVPEQFETKIRDGRLVTTALSHVGA